MTTSGPPDGVQAALARISSPRPSADDFQYLFTALTPAEYDDPCLPRGKFAAWTKNFLDILVTSPVAFDADTLVIFQAYLNVFISADFASEYVQQLTAILLKFAPIFPENDLLDRFALPLSSMRGFAAALQPFEGGETPLFDTVKAIWGRLQDSQFRFLKNLILDGRVERQFHDLLLDSFNPARDTGDFVKLIEHPNYFFLVPELLKRLGNANASHDMILDILERVLDRSTDPTLLSQLGSILPRSLFAKAFRERPQFVTTLIRLTEAQPQLCELLARSDLDDDTWARLLQVGDNFPRLFSIVETPDIAKRLVLVSLDCFSPRWDLATYAIILRSALPFTPELLDERRLRRMHEIFQNNESKSPFFGWATSTIPFSRANPELEWLVTAANFDNVCAELCTPAFIDVFFWIKPRNRRLELLSRCLLLRRPQAFISVCLQHCEMLEAWSCALYMILDVAELPSITNLPDSVDLRQQGEIQLMLAAFFVMVAVLSRVFSFVPRASPWHGLTEWVVRGVLPKVAGVCWKSDRALTYIWCAFSSIVGTMDVSITNKPQTITGVRKVTMEVNGSSAELEERWTATTAVCDFPEFINRKVAKVRRNAGVDETANEKSRTNYFLALFADVVWVSLDNLGKIPLEDFLLRLTTANPFSAPGNFSISTPLLQILIDQLSHTHCAFPDRVVDFCCKRVADGVFGECPAAILGSLIPLAISNRNLLAALDATCGSLLEFGVRAAETKQNFLRVFDTHLPQLLPVMNEDDLIALASVFAAFADANELMCRRLFGRLAKSPKKLSEDIRAWLHFQDFVVPGEITERVGAVIEAIKRRARDRGTDVSATRAEGTRPAVLFCQQRSTTRAEAAANRAARERLVETMQTFDECVFEALRERRGLFRFRPSKCCDFLSELVFRVVFQCPKGTPEKIVEVEMGGVGVKGHCLLIGQGQEILLLQTFDSTDPRFEVMFEIVADQCEKFNGHAVYRVRKEEREKTDRGELFQRGHFQFCILNS